MHFWKGQCGLKKACILMCALPAAAGAWAQSNFILSPMLKLLSARRARWRQAACREWIACRQNLPLLAASWAKALPGCPTLVGSLC